MTVITYANGRNHYRFPSRERTPWMKETSESYKWTTYRAVYGYILNEAKKLPSKQVSNIPQPVN